VSYLARIDLYPIKSLDGVAVNQATVLKSGALAFDREFAIFDQQGQFVNGKRDPQVHLLRCTFDCNARTVSLQVQGTEQKQVFHLEDERSAIITWLSDYFGFHVQFLQNSLTGFPDDTNAPGPTVISTATLETVTAWFPGLTLEKMRIRLRTNLEIDGVPPFWEDQLFVEVGQVVQFQVGDVQFEGINPCQRCVIPTREPLTTKAYPNFQKIFVAKRRETLPDWATLSRFNHFYRLAVNTRIPESEAMKTLRVGNSIKILDTSNSK
jgi:uncharacterized protein YcbX